MKWWQDMAGPDGSVLAVAEVPRAGSQKESREKQKVHGKESPRARDFLMTTETI